MRDSWVRTGAWCVLLSGLFFLSACQNTQTLVAGKTMGTTYSVVLADAMDSSALAQLKEDIEERLRQINQSMSTYMEDSEISVFNQSTSTQWFGVSEDFAKVVKTALEVSRLSSGAFDITVYSLVDLWGFGPSQMLDKTPTQAEIQRGMSRLGYQNLEVRADMSAIRKHEHGIQIDLSGIAKGYAVDELAKLLSEQGVVNYLVEIGGELRAKGLSAQGQRWRVGVKNPFNPNRSIKTVYLTGGIATSGDYYNFRAMEGNKFSHHIDPATGNPMNYQTVSVTVIAPSAMLADAWSTALVVLGKSKGYAVAQQLNLAAYFVYASKKENQAVKQRWTKAFSSYFDESLSH